jgi:hypothetical protein
MFIIACDVQEWPENFPGLKSSRALKTPHVALSSGGLAAVA